MRKEVKAEEKVSIGHTVLVLYRVLFVGCAISWISLNLEVFLI